VGNLGGATGPWILGQIKDATGSYANGFYFLASSMFIASAIVYFLGLGIRKPKGTA
jgi:ACS family tartrate transporter-like MFS transporter